MSKDVKKAVSYCTFCPKMCRFACPASEFSGDEAFVPSNKQARLWEILEGRNSESLRKESIYAFTGCFMCGACRNYCYHDIDVSPYMALGRQLVNPLEAYEKAVDILDGIKRTGNFFGEELSLSGFSLSDAVEKDVLLFPGCFVLKYESELLEKVHLVLSRSGVNFVGLPEDPSTLCCGYPLYALGLKDDFKSHAQKVKSLFSGISTVVTLCPHCAYTIDALYKEIGVKVKVEVLTHVEYLLQVKFVPEKILRTPFVYHDPCYLARYRGVVADARRLLWRAVDEIRDFPENGEDADCCGGGGLVPEINPPLADAVTDARLQGLDEKYEIIAPCPHCRQRFRSRGRSALDVLDVFERSLR